MAGSSSSGGTNALLVVTIVLTVLAAVAGGVYMSGAADDVIKFVMEKYFKAEARAEEKMLEKSGEGAAEGFLYVCSYSCPSFRFLSFSFLFHSPIVQSMTQSN